MTPLLQVDGLSVRAGSALALDGLDLSLAGPVWCGVLGANGSGKTTLLRCLSGRLPPAAGEIRLEGKLVTRDAGARAARVGFAPETGKLPIELSSAELISVVRRAHGAGPPTPLLLRLEEALGLAAQAHRPIGALSSGLKQRLAIYLAFVASPPVVLLDEPFNWLDPVAAYDLKAVLQEMVDAGACAVITTLHDTGTFAARCGQGLLLQEGRVAETFSQAALRAGARDLPAFEAEIARRFRQGLTSQP
jgi:ABC-type multidrug transport system ATPase subunit